MKKQLAKRGIAGALLALGLIVTGCASAGRAARFDPPSGDYYSSSRGIIVFDAAGGSWEADGLGYRGSFDFNGETGGITLNAEQSLSGFNWVDIDPVQGFSTGQIKGESVRLGDLAFVRLNFGD
jgi:hypothetical protein